MDKGFLFIATGDRFVSEATRSAQRIQDLTDIDIAIVTDSEILEDGDPFDIVISETEMEKSWGTKPAAIRQTPFEHTIYLDTDTFVVDEEAIEDIFELLERGIEVAVTHDSHASADHYYNLEERPPVRFTYPWYNTGVMGFRLSAVESILESWAGYQASFEEQYPGINDQAAFRQAIYESEIHPHVLPVEYNYRAQFLTILRERVRIIHAHVENFEEITQKVNSGPIPRRRAMYSISGGNEFHIIELRVPQLLKSMMAAIETTRREGIVGTIRRTCKYFANHRD